jgi:hypothetical protein
MNTATSSSAQSEPAATPGAGLLLPVVVAVAVAHARRGIVVRRRAHERHVAGVVTVGAGRDVGRRIGVAEPVVVGVSHARGGVVAGGRARERRGRVVIAVLAGRRQHVVGGRGGAVRDVDARAGGAEAVAVGVEAVAGGPDRRIGRGVGIGFERGVGAPRPRPWLGCCRRRRQWPRLRRRPRAAMRPNLTSD